MTLQTVRHQNNFAISLLQKPESINPVPHGLSTDVKLPRVLQHVYVVAEHTKTTMIIDLLVGKQSARVLIYVKTNHAADALAENLNRAGITAESVHGNKSQRTKAKTLANFSNKFTNVLVATESAASLIDTDVALIVNFDLPLSAETYKKRIDQRTANGLEKVISLCDICEQPRLSNINRAFPGEIEVIDLNRN